MTALVFCGLVLFCSGRGVCRTDTAGQAEQDVTRSVEIRRASHQEKEQWEREKAGLVSRYEQLQQQYQSLEKDNRHLKDRQTALNRENQSLLKQKQDILRVQRELMPFLKDVTARLSGLVTGDPPFLKKERTGRLSALEHLMDDPQVSISEKYRKVMEALFIEAEYGTTIEVYQEKVLVDGQDILGNIFRLGRVSLFFLSLDHTACAVFNPGTESWQLLPDTHLSAVQSAVEIGSKRRPAELLSLPLGRLAGGEDGP